MRWTETGVSVRRHHPDCLLPLVGDVRAVAEPGSVFRLPDAFFSISGIDDLFDTDLSVKQGAAALGSQRNFECKRGLLHQLSLHAYCTAAHCPLVLTAMETNCPLPRALRYRPHPCDSPIGVALRRGLIGWDSSGRRSYCAEPST